MIQIEHNNRLYKNNRGKLEITHSDGRHFRTPEILYKYYALNNNSVDAFTNHYLYASHPLELNDRFDCSPFLISFENPDDELILLKEINPATKATIEELQLDGFGGYHDEIVEYYYKRWGIISFSPVNDETLMWSHYAKNDGFCIKLRTSKLPNEWIGPYPIDYPRSREACKIKYEHASIIPLLQCFQKNSHWSYEKELRYLVQIDEDDKRKSIYSKDAIEGIYFGSSFIKDNEKDGTDCPWKVRMDIQNENDVFRMKVFNYAIREGIPIHFACSIYIDDINFMPCIVGETDNHYIVHQQNQDL